MQWEGDQKCSPSHLFAGFPVDYIQPIQPIQHVGSEHLAPVFWNKDYMIQEFKNTISEKESKPRDFAANFADCFVQWYPDVDGLYRCC